MSMAGKDLFSPTDAPGWDSGSFSGARSHRQNDTADGATDTAGGGSRSDQWTRMLATILNIPQERPDEGAYGAALGAARIAMCGVTGANPKEVMTKPPVKDVIDPDPNLVAAYDDAYRGFAAAYPTLKAMP